ncbi:NTP transferase domain-containing protein [Megalodesulfovibrio gigas]|uniref:Putative 4-diphosphocytidyl-2C-methyl-D-erythritol synthase n=1 Tax=Megalodesulfovibrio gigas (strain ATCC 19364 / DSM 1382 / NCIMB 9332 / VKM B-1759) TaxID=1121448 RepID=T2GCW7_MEGG1|nr:NTP transferase domain-containing protein [Megalodesulfovibrio gigas]AGW14425.1 putative 4-diphosphocytidyl-2C-methyl-D-erythritol synthase [Megalodesulfovibrio gigas DSM 1382 = ATCC 19364]
MNHFPCIIPAAGLGTRMAEICAATGGAPFKELLPVAGMPAILHAVALAAAAGADTVAVVLRPGKEAIRDCIDQHRQDVAPGCEIVYRWQAEPGGEGRAILQCRDVLEGVPAVGVIYPDNLYQPPADGDSRSPLAILREAAEGAGQAAAAVTDTIGLHRPDAAGQDALAAYANAGRLDLAPHPACIPGLRLVTRCYAKGPGPFMPRRPGEARACGLYVATPRYVEALDAQDKMLPQGEELTDGHARRHLLAEGRPLQAFLLPGLVFDMGTPAGHALARRHLGA